MSNNFPITHWPSDLLKDLGNGKWLFKPTGQILTAHRHINYTHKDIVWEPLPIKTSNTTLATWQEVEYGLFGG